MKYEEKFIAFIDVLGFSQMVAKAEQDGNDFGEMLALLAMLGSDKGSSRFTEYGPETCPESNYVSRDLSFKITQISDCVVISAEVSAAGVINLISHCHRIVLKLLLRGYLVRGVITRGNILHDDQQFIGTGYMAAYAGERHVSVFGASNQEVGTPYVQVESIVSEYIATSTDKCVQDVFHRLTNSDGRDIAIWPFRMLGSIPSAIITLDFDPAYWKEQVIKSRGFRRETLKLFEDAELRAPSENEARKIVHYKRGMIDVINRLNEQENILDEMIRTRSIPYGTYFN